MTLVELLDLCALALFLFLAIIAFNFILGHIVNTPIKDLFFKCGIFVLLSIVILLLPEVSLLTPYSALGTPAVQAIHCLWWFSINLMANEALTYFIWDRLLPSKGVTVSKLLRDLTSLVLIIITIAFIFHFVFHQSVVGLFTASGVMAVILGYSAQATLGEAFAGVGLNITKQFDTNDWIDIGGNTGQVVDVTWRFVCLLTKDGNHLTIPNSVISKSLITNYSRPDLIHGAQIKITLPQYFSPALAKKMIETAAASSLSVSTTMPPKALLAALGGDASTHHQYTLYYFTEGGLSTPNNEILSALWYISLREERKLTNKENDYSHEDVLQFLQKIDLFSSLTFEELKHLATEAKQTFYGPPERILTQGQANDSLFLIFKGGADVYLHPAQMHPTKVASLGEGHYFGEMSLLTGEPAGASIIINQESTLLEITNAAMAALFDRNPAVIEKISAVIVARKQQNEQFEASLEQSKETKVSLIQQLAERIKNFFKKTIS